MNWYRRLRKLVWKISLTGLPRGPHLTRYFMYRRLASVGRKLPQRTGRVLSISRSVNLVEVMGLQPTKVVKANYPEHNVLSLRFENDSFDVVLSDQVLEHVEGNPQQAIDECRRVLKPGGIVVHTTCFINPVHGEPKDFWRFTPDALRLLHQGWTDIVECGGWGNFDAWKVVEDGLRFEGVPHATWHPLHRVATKNDRAWPIVTWIVARK